MTILDEDVLSRGRSFKRKHDCFVSFEHNSRIDGKKRGRRSASSQKRDRRVREVDI